MAEGELYEKVSKKGGLTAGDCQGETEPFSLVQKLRTRITKSVQSKVDSILLDVQKLSDNDKLYLYLQLPPGPSAPEKSNVDISGVNTAEHMYACTWIRNHLEEHTDTCLPKQDVYDAYKRYCDNLCGRPLSVANFGKIIREIFPNIKARRLGGRGQSKYCYSGLRRKSMVSMPPLPSLDLKMAESSELTDLVQSYNNDVINASCALICNWAEKILKRSFNNVVEVAQFLIQQHIINPRSANAELVLSMVLSENSQSGAQKIPKPTADATSSARPATPDGSSDPSAKIKKVAHPPPECPQPLKKRPSDAPKTVSSPQVDALVARLPVLLPRLSSEDKFVSSSSPIRFAAPVLASNILPGPLKVSPLPFASVPPGVPLAVTAGVNGAGLVSQPVAPKVISMILPEVVSLETPPLPKTTPKGPSRETPGAPGGNSENRGARRHAASPSAAGGDCPSKRKRGRPRKLDAPHLAKSSTPGGSVIERRCGEDSSRGCTPPKTTATPTPSQPKDAAASHAEAKETLRREAAAGGTPPRPPVPPQPAEKQEKPSPAEPRNPPAATAPIQVSVIQDGRQSAVHWTVRRGMVERMQRATEQTVGSATGEGERDTVHTSPL
ncbi:DNA-binding protein RFX5 [Spea bombifrons]|uniref:DNA-binding protein RFX5 n=1 Tax=Spea bombifrons TaxID=233779 RepID=UPI002349D8FE|nr:DNA-binding protein RFX5 [Spea bombifrons]